MKGFTLIEMLVSVAIFTVVMTMALSALLIMTESDRRAQTLKVAVNNLNFSLESMSRTIRTGFVYHCDINANPITSPRDCNSGATSLAFLDADRQQIVYCRGEGSSCSSSGAAILRSVNGGAYSQITSPEVSISGLLFYVTGAESAAIQPKVTILLSGSVLLDKQIGQPAGRLKLLVQ